MKVRSQLSAPPTANTALRCILTIALVGASGAIGCGSSGTGGGTGVISTADGSNNPDLQVGDVPALDAGPEVPDGPTLPPEEIASQCEDLCSDIAAECGGYDEVGGSLQACTADCETALAEDLGWIGNYSCIQEACSAALCLLGEDIIEESSECQAACSRIDECDLWALLGDDGPESIDTCAAECSGSIVGGNPLTADIVVCLGESLAEGCDEAAAQACFDVLFEEGCAATCAGLMTPAGGDQYCPGDTELAQTWGDEEGCVEACMDRPVGQHGPWEMCLLFIGCGDPGRCDDMPTSTPQNCAAACDALGERCPEADTDSFCTNMCGVVVGWSDGDAASPGGADCIAANQTCDDGTVWEALGCMTPVADACVGMCDKLIPCVPATTEYTMEQCLSQCSFGLVFQEEVTAERNACIMEAAGCFDMGPCFANPLDISEEVAATVCEETCANIGTNCDGYPGEMGNQAGCVAFCTGQTAENPMILANLQCFAGSCNGGQCLSGAIEATEACLDGCATLDECQLLGIFDLPQGEVGACVATCSGNSVTNPANDWVMACVDNALQDQSCNAEALNECSDPPVTVYCGTVCDNVYNDSGPSDQLYCAPGTAVHAMWGSADACTEACEALDVDAVYPWALCMQFGDGCGDPQGCLDIAATHVAGCTEACEAVDTACPDPGVTNLADPALCNGFCQYFLAAGGLTAAAEDAVSCIEGWSECPEDAFGPLIGCVVPSSATCEATCADLLTCPVDFDAADCDSGCAQMEITQPEAATQLHTCVAEATDCDAKEACLPIETVCGGYCYAQDVCGAGSETCMPTCEDAVKADNALEADYSCSLALGCESAETCDGLGATPVPVECETACAASPDTCDGHPDGACSRVCQGIIQATLGIQDNADCITGALGPDCDTGSALAMCAGL